MKVIEVKLIIDEDEFNDLKELHSKLSDENILGFKLLSFLLEKSEKEFQLLKNKAEINVNLKEYERLMDEEE